MSTERRIRWAVVGLGHISQVAVLPAFRNARRGSELVALVSGDEEKRAKLARRHRVPAFDYDELERCIERCGVEAVYLGVPNHLHCDHAIRAMRAGAHVLCEKPMAVTSGECEQMMEVAAARGVKLMVAYRLHFERANLEAVEVARSGRIGEPRLFQSTFTMQVREGNVRLAPRQKGGGPLFDIGIYCVNAARYLFRAEPVEVNALAARQHDPRFSEVDSCVAVTMRFPDERLATFSCSFGAADVSAYRIVGTRGDIAMEPAYEYAESLAWRLTVDGRTRTRRFRKRDQFAPELIHFADCIRDDEEPGPSGEEGWTDVRIVEAIHDSIDHGRPVWLDLPERLRRPSLEQEIRRPPVRKPVPVEAESASS